MYEEVFGIKPQPREVRSMLLFAGGPRSNRLQVILGGEDRTKLLSELCQEVWDYDDRERITIDGCTVNRLEDTVSINMLLRPRNSDWVKNRQTILGLEERLRKVVAKPIQGMQIPVRRIVDMAVVAPDRAGQLCAISQLLADAGINITRFEGETMATPPDAPSEVEARCFLEFRLQLPKEDSQFCDEMGNRITNLEPGKIRVGFGPEIHRMRVDAFKEMYLWPETPFGDKPVVIDRRHETN